MKCYYVHVANADTTAGNSRQPQIHETCKTKFIQTEPMTPKNNLTLVTDDSHVTRRTNNEIHIT